MNKNNLIELILKETTEIGEFVKKLSQMEQIPPIMFQITDSKFDTIKRLIDLLAKESSPQHSDEFASEPTTVSMPPVENLLSQVEVSSPVPVASSPDDVVENKATQVEQPVVEKTVEEASLSSPDASFGQKQQASPQLVTPPKEKDVPGGKDSKKDKKSTIGETIIEKKFSVNEKLVEKANTSIDQTFSGRKITDLKKSINLNDKFRFQKELFGGDAALLNDTLEKLNVFERKSQALEFLSHFAWDGANATVKDFMELVNRKFL